MSEGLAPGPYRCEVHRYHAPAPLALVVHHVLPRAMGGPDTVDNEVVVCDTGHRNIHRILGVLIRGAVMPRPYLASGHRGELEVARRGFEAWVGAGRPGRPVFEVVGTVGA